MAFVPLRTVVGTDEEDSGFKPLRDVYLGPAPQRNVLAAGLSSGVDQLQSLGYSALGGTADLLGATTARDWANEQARRNQIDASLAGRPDLENIEDQSLSSALPYMGYQIAKQVPIMAGIAGLQFIPGAGQAAGALGLTRLGATLPRFVGGGGLEAGASIAARRAALTQGETLATGTMAGSALGFGSMYGESVEGGDPNAWKALALSPIYGAAEAVLPAVLHGGMRLPSRYSGGLATRMAKAGGVAGAGETLTELGQNELEMGMRSDLTPEEIASRRLNSAAAGFLVGGGLGTTGGFKGKPTGLDTRQIDLMSGESKVPPAPPLQLGFSPLAGTPIIFPDGTIALNGDQEMLARTGIKLPIANQETDLTATAADTSAPAAAGTTLSAASAQSTVPSIFSKTDEDLNALNIKPTDRSRNIYNYMVSKGIDPTSEEAEPIINALSERKYKFATDTVGEIIRARSPRGTGVSTVQQSAGGLGVGGAVVPGTLGAAGSNAPIEGGVGGTTAAAGAPSGQAGVLPSTAGQPSTAVTTTAAPVVTTTAAPAVTTTAAPAVTTTAAPVAPAAPVSQQLAPGQFRRAPKPMTVLETADAAKAAQTQQTETQGSQAPAAAQPDIVSQIFGEQDADIVRGFLMGRSSAELAAEAKAKGIKGRSEQMIRNKIAGEMAVREEWPKKIAVAKAKYGYTDAQIQEAIKASIAPDVDTRSQVERELNLGRANLYGVRMSETEAAEAGLEGSVKSAGAGSSAVKGFTQLQKNVDAMYKRLETEKDPLVLAYISHRLTELQKQVEAFEDKEQARIRATAGVEEDGEVDLVAAAKQAEPETVSINNAEEARKAEAEKLRAEAAAKRSADRKGLEVGDTVVNPKLGTGVVKGFSGDGDATLVTVDFQSGETKELSVKMAKLEKTNAVQVESTAVVPVQSETKTGQGVGGQVRRTEKPAGKGQVAVQSQTKGQVSEGQTLWANLSAQMPGLVSYDQLTKLEQEYLDDLAVRTNGKPAVAKEMGLQQLLAKEPVTIDVESRVVEETVGPKVAALPAPQVDRLEKHYNLKRDSAEFLTKVKDDIVLYVNKGASAVAGAIRDVIKTLAEGVLAVSLIFNPNANLDRFEFNVQKVITETKEVRAEVPAEAAAKMSDLAKDVYSRVAPAAMASGKSFIVADKPNGMIHVFTSEGKVIVQDTALFGKDSGDTMDGRKVTPAGKFTMKSEKWDAYAGGFTLDVFTSKGEFEGVAVHAAYLGHPSENRLSRLATPTAADNKISGGCINTAHDTFIKKIIPNLDTLDGGMLFILPDAQETTASMFPAETRTETRTEGGKGAKGVAAAQVVGKEENMLFGKDGKAKKPYTAKQLLAELKDFIRADIPGRKLMVVDTIDDLLNDPDPKVQAVGEAIQKENAYGVATDGRAFLIADRINKGSGRAKFMHEVGAHLGLENLLTKQTYNKLIQQLQSWAKKQDGSLESVLAQRATERFESAGTAEGQQNNELLAYFLEEAIDAGIDPTATSKESGPLMDWFRTLWAAFKIAARKLGFKPESLTAQDVVNLAFGAARLEINGTWHGTAAAFRKFNHDFMGTGEGAQAYGWGSYFAQSVGIAKGYWKADVNRKGGVGGGIQTLLSKRLENAKQQLLKYDSDTPVYDSRTDADMTPERRAQIVKATRKYIEEIKAQLAAAVPEGSLMRVDIPIADEDVLNWDEPLSKQPAILAKIEASISDILREDLEDQVGADLAEMTGDEFYRGLGFVEVRTGAVSEEFDVEDYNKRLANSGFKEVVSKYLDEKLGIPALKFLDQSSRGDKFQTQIKLKQLQEILREKELAVEKATKEAAKWEALQDKAPSEQKAYARQTWLNAVSARTSAEFQAEEVRQEVQILKQKVIGLENPTRNVVVFNDKNIFRVGSQTAADRQRMQFGKNAPNEGLIQRNIAKLPKAAQQPVRLSLGAINDAVSKGLDYVVFTSDLVDRATKAGILSAKKFVDLIGKSKAEARENEIAVEKISDMYALVPEKDRGTGEGSVNRFLFDSTREGKWGYGKYRNDEVGARFDALSPESQAYVEAVFAHGSDILAKKKKLVLDSTNSEYDAMIAAAKAEGDTATEVRLTKEKEAALKRFQTLFRLRDGIPYAPIKRNGSHVVIAKSQEYLDAEAADDKKRIAELESNSDHYHVSFTDGKWEARTLKDELNNQGFFADVQIAERDNVIDEMFSGHSALRELTKMRSRVDEQAKTGDKSATKMLSLISQMYLEALAEGSARKSEMRRRGVAGEVDMIRSFAQQGRADANFMASVKYSPQVQQALQEMRTQAKKGDRERKSEVFKELAKRYVQSLEYSPRPWLNKLTRMSSLYHLATSPAYYLQNLTQPWMMSVPAMAGRHDYTTASGALFKAYTELGGVMKSAKLLKQQFDFEKVPADVRDAIKELVNRGKIDIGLDTEIGEFKVEGDGYFAGKISAADKALRLAVQKVESINRLSTAMAAYRLELAKKGNKEDAIDYADRILTETHGDYTSFNAPRAFNTGYGKVALQFRKFQLIQLAFYAKLIRDSLTGADRAAAFKTLTYSLAHTGMLAGVMGVPGYAAAAWLAGILFSDDDDKYNLTEEIRKAIGDEDVANLVLRGAPTLIGADISGKVGAGNMLSIQPFSKADLSTPSGIAEYIGTAVGGASLGMATRMIDGLGLMMSGDWYRGIEQTMPKGVSDAMKAYRIANEGLTRRNGDIILPPEEVSSLDTILQGLGIEPVKQAVVYERQNLMKETTKNFVDRTTRIKNDYIKATRAGDSEAQGQAREAWQKLQAVKKENGVNTSPLSELLKAPAEQKKREKMTVGGVQYTKGTRKLAEEIAGE
jgi:hypothetical protein